MTIFRVEVAISRICCASRDGVSYRRLSFRLLYCFAMTGYFLVYTMIFKLLIVFDRNFVEISQNQTSVCSVY